MAIRYIGDWHYDHANCLAFDNRPFSSVKDMNMALIHNWNAVTAPDDDVYILGDMFWCGAVKACTILHLLNGKKYLIKGNHDRVGDREFASNFVWIKDYAEIKDGGRNIVLFHYPIPCFKNHYHGWYHLYAHVHSGFEHNMMLHDKYLMEELYEKKCRMYNVGAMMPWINYAPRTLDEIINANKGED